jgi:anti-anti-sigma factor
MISLPASPPQGVAAMLKMTVLSDDGDVVSVQCEGDISEVKFQLNDNPLEGVLGPDVYARKVLLALDRVGFLDSNGISWLVVSHKHFQKGGGAMALHSIPPRIQQVLQYCRMDRMLRLAVNETTARALVATDKPS